MHNYTNLGFFQVSLHFFLTFYSTTEDNNKTHLSNQNTAFSLASVKRHYYDQAYASYTHDDATYLLFQPLISGYLDLYFLIWTCFNVFYKFYKTVDLIENHLTVVYTSSSVSTISSPVTRTELFLLWNWSIPSTRKFACEWQGTYAS